MKEDLSVLEDMEAIKLPVDAKLMALEDGKVIATHEIRGIKLLTWFIGDGIIHIYLWKNKELKQLKKYTDYELLNLNWVDNPSLEYRTIIMNMIVQ